MRARWAWREQLAVVGPAAIAVVIAFVIALQWVKPAGGGFNVRATIRALFASVIRGGRPERGLSSRPRKPSMAKRRRIRLT